MFHLVCQVHKTVPQYDDYDETFAVLTPLTRQSGTQENLWLWLSYKEFLSVTSAENFRTRSCRLCIDTISSNKISQYLDIWLLPLSLQYVFQVVAIWCWTDEWMGSREKCFDGKIKRCPDTPSVLITRRPVMFVPLRPTLCDRNSSGLHDCIIMHFTFIQICCSKHWCDGSTRLESEQPVKTKKQISPRRVF